MRLRLVGLEGKPLGDGARWPRCRRGLRIGLAPAAGVAQSAQRAAVIILWRL